MVNMKTLIRIVFVIFIANGIDCLGGVCDNCCDCFKDKDENEGIAISLVNDDWYKSKKNNLVLKIFEENNGIITSTDNKYTISIESNEKDNPKITCKKGPKNKLNLGEQKYALFEIKTQKEEETVYLYCSDVESIGNNSGIFFNKDHKSISVIACDTEKVTNMWHMFANCKSLEKLEFGKSFNTSNVRDMKGMFYRCSSLTKLDLKNFNTKNVTNMEGMFCNCSNLKEINFGNNFNTSNVTNMGCMFYDCSSLGISEISEIEKKIDTTKVTNKTGMFYWHS